MQKISSAIESRLMARRDSLQEKHHPTLSEATGLDAVDVHTARELRAVKSSLVGSRCLSGIDERSYHPPKNITDHNSHFTDP